LSHRVGLPNRASGLLSLLQILESIFTIQATNVRHFPDRLISGTILWMHKKNKHK
jgi:hypothetical protein